MASRSSMGFIRFYVVIWREYSGMAPRLTFRVIVSSLLGLPNTHSLPILSYESYQLLEVNIRQIAYPTRIHLIPSSSTETDAVCGVEQVPGVQRCVIVRWLDDFSNFTYGRTDRASHGDARNTLVHLTKHLVNRN